MRQLAGFGGPLLAVLAAVVLSELPPVSALAGWIESCETAFLLTGGALFALGLALFIGATIKLAMDHGRALEHAAVEEAERSMRIAARPVTARASFYRVLGHAAGRGASESFGLRDLKSAWRTGAVRRNPEWRRRSLTVVGALLLMTGACLVPVAVGPAWVKVLVGGALAYALGRTASSFWRS